jgi:hypothetical protein
MVTGQELPALEFAPMTAAVLTGVLVSGEEESVRDLAAEATRHMDEAHQPNHRREWQFGPWRAEGPPRVHFENFGLLVENQTNGPTSRNDGQRLE